LTPFTHLSRMTEFIDGQTVVTVRAQHGGSQHFELRRGRH